MVKDEPDKRLVDRMDPPRGGKRPERGWLVGGAQGEKRGEEGEGVKREIEKLEEACQDVKSETVANGGRLVQRKRTCLEDGRALGKKESKHVRPRRNRMLFRDRSHRRDRRVHAARLDRLEGGGMVGGMEIEEKMM
jgi:hypothetical protein